MKYKIVISEITEEEIPATEYKNLRGYVETGKTEIDRNERAIYEQEIEDLDVAEVALFLNRVR